MVSSKHDLLFFNQYEVEHKVDNILSQNNLYITLQFECLAVLCISTQSLWHWNIF